MPACEAVQHIREREWEREKAVPMLEGSAGWKERGRKMID